MCLEEGNGVGGGGFLVVFGANMSVKLLAEMKEICVFKEFLGVYFSKTALALIFIEES